MEAAPRIEHQQRQVSFSARPELQAANPEFERVRKELSMKQKRFRLKHKSQIHNIDYMKLLRKNTHIHPPVVIQKQKYVLDKYIRVFEEDANFDFSQSCVESVSGLRIPNFHDRHI